MAMKMLVGKVALAAVVVLSLSSCGAKESDSAGTSASEVAQADGSAVTTTVDTVGKVEAPDAETVPEKKPANKPLTQFMLVRVVDETGTPSIRDAEDLKGRLMSMGFKVKVDGPNLTATRKGANGGVTSVKAYYPLFDTEVNKITIDFADEEEKAGFVQTLQGTGWTQSGAEYIHPRSMSGENMVHASVKGNVATLYEDFD